jgi:hypothetical protein
VPAGARGFATIEANRACSGDFEPSGDFSLLFGAAKQGLKIVDLPIRYRECTSGSGSIQRGKHGWLLLKMTLSALWRMKLSLPGRAGR